MAILAAPKTAGNCIANHQAKQASINSSTWASNRVTSVALTMLSQDNSRLLESGNSSM